MNGKYTLSFIEKDNERKESRSGYSLPMLDKVTTEFESESGIIATFQEKLLPLLPNKVVISYRNITNTADIEVEPCYSDNKLLKGMFASLSRNIKGEDVVDSKNLFFKKTVENFITYCSISKPFVDYARSFMMLDEEDIIGFVEGVNDGIYGYSLLIETLQKYENIRSLTIILMKALKDPEIVKSIYFGYNDRLREIHIPQNLSELINYAIAPFNNDFEESLDSVYEHMSFSERKNEEIQSITNLISERNDFREDYKDVLKQSSDFQI